MNAPDLLVETWADFNQRWLVARIALLRQRIEGMQDAPEAVHDEPEIDPSAFIPALQHIATTFGLSTFERDTLLLAAAYELDAPLRRALGARPTFALAMALLDASHWDALSPQAPLRYWRLLSLATDAPLAEAGLRIDERVLHALAGVEAFDEKLAGRVQLVRQDAAALDPSSFDVAFAERLAAAVASPQAAGPVVAAPDASAASIATALRAAGWAPLRLRAADLPHEPEAAGDLARLIDREAALRQGVLLIALDDDAARDGSAPSHTAPRRLAAWLDDELRSPVVLLGRAQPGLLALLAQRRVRTVAGPRLPAVAGPTQSPALQAALGRALQQFHLPPARVESALAGLDAATLAQPAEPLDATGDAALDATVWQTLRVAARGGLDGLAQRIDAPTTLADLVLPRAQLAQLHTIGQQLRQRERVYQDWGFAQGGTRGLGLAALFAGESGTGKTMAAEAIANEAGLDLYAIDLASVVSKYIGETEKNLGRLFDAAEASGAVLLFDEADALFGKRSEVKDSHDRYANIEIAYLLQRIEAYRGLAVLTTNMKSALDRAFLRRIRFVVQFPFPDEAARAAIWRGVWPAQAPVGELDIAALARLKLAGGHIRSIALNAAFKAAEQGGRIEQATVIEAAHAELAKLERTMTGAGAAS
jgi:hypothetical protein